MIMEERRPIRAYIIELEKDTRIPKKQFEYMIEKS
jgi:hypothetical protein